MMDNENQNQPNQKISFESLDILIGKWRDGTFSEIIDDWKWIFSYSKRYKGAIAFYTILGIFSTSMGLVGSVASKYMIDIITGYQMSKLWIMVLITLGSAFFSLTIGNVIGRISTKLSIYINNDIQADIFDKIMSLLAFASAPFMLLMSKFLISKQREYGKKVREMSSEMMTFEVETFYNFDTIKSFGISSLYGKKMRNWQEKFKDISLKYNMFTIKTNIVMSIIGMVVQYAAFGYCLFRLWTRDISYGTMTLFLQQRSNLNGAFNNLVSIIPNFLNSSISAHRIRELAQLKKEVHIPESSEMDAYVEDGFEVKMRDVDFSYIEGNRVITDSAFMANPGEIVALVGPSGEGKTTMIRLILGLIHPEKGEAYLRASNGKQVEMNADTRHLFAYVPQGNTILSGTIAENLRMVKQDATEEEMIEALKISCAWDFVKNMEETIYTKIGERGRGFSEGQAQRIAIARAVLRDAPILLLDEATSALDVTTERKVLRNIIKQRPNKTCIVTTHRPSVLNMCQRVYRVMETQVTELSEEESSKMAMDF